MREALETIYSSCVFRETFRSETECRRNGGNPINVTFVDGVATIVDTTSRINYTLSLNGTYSVRIRCKVTAQKASVQYLFDARGGDGTGYAYLNGGSATIISSSGTIYVNGVAAGSITYGSMQEIVITGISLVAGTTSGQNTLALFNRHTLNFAGVGTCDLFEIYQGTLTASEVANLSNNKWNKEIKTMKRSNQYSCDLTVTGWQRCADNTGTNQGANGVGQALKQVGLGSGVGAGTDLVGFSANLSGRRHTNGSFINLGSGLYLWSSTPYSSTSAWRRYLNTSYSTVYRTTSNMDYGFSIRCLRDTDDTSDFTDPRDGNIYPCVKIGNQVWMKKNLAYLPSVNLVTDGSETDPKYYVYDYSGTDVEVAKATAEYQEYGVLYNWPGAMASAPEGFHVPSDEELNELELYTLERIRESQPDKLLLDFDSTAGTIKDRTGLRTLTPIDVSIKKIGQSYSADFNGVTSKIDTGSDFIGTKAVTVCGWIKARSWGGSNRGVIFDNGKTRLWLYNPTGQMSLIISSDDVLGSTAGNSSITLNKPQFVSVTRTSAGLVNFYIGDTKNSPALSGSADKASGTPVAGTRNVIIGSSPGASRTFDGSIPMLKFYEGILSLEDITQIWSSTRKNYI